ncbi:hypothetical protein ACFWUP_19435 [Nocardia sp. NPDC058658]|uniref:TRADD-N-associated membrane domain-containing protein n=1 Tax=Nocardia sp. NPDC058658 TaxID=3346580 RepID=UPI00364DC1DF
MDEILALVGVGGLIPTVVAAVSAWWSTAFSRRINKRAVEATVANELDSVMVSRPSPTRKLPDTKAGGSRPEGGAPRPEVGASVTEAEGTLPPPLRHRRFTTQPAGTPGWRNSRPAGGPSRRLGSTATSPHLDRDERLRAQPTIDPSPAIRHRTDEYLRQVRSAQAQSSAFFWAYMISGCCGVVVVLAAASMVAFGNRDAAAATSIMGAVPVGITALFYKRSTDLDKMVSENLTRLSRADETAEANRAAHDVVSRMGPGADQDRLLAMIGVRQLFPLATPAEVAELLHAVPITSETEQ